MLKRHIRYLIVSFIVFLVACTSFVLLLMQIRNNKKISDKAEVEWQTESTKRYDLNSLERSLKNIQEERNALESHFVSEDAVVPFLNYIEGLGKVVNIKTQIVSVDNNTKDKEGPSLMIGVQTQGSFENNYKFLELLENAAYELQFPNVELRRQTALAEDSLSPVWTGNFKLKVISFVPSAKK